MFFNYRILFLIGSVSSFLFCSAGQQTAPVPTLEEENKEADRAFLDWKLDHTTVSPSLKTFLNPHYRALLVKEASVPFDGPLSQKELNAKVTSVMDNLASRGALAQQLEKRELKRLIEELIKPEYVFENDTRSSHPLDKVYNEMMNMFAERLTPAGTTLRQWALRFLIAESVIIALAVIKKMSFGGKTFSELNPNNQKKALELVVELITQRFMQNLAAVTHQYQLVLPDRTDSAIKYKVRLFLFAKFIS